MVMYAYQAVDAQGKRKKGLHDAANLLDLETRLQRNGLDLINAKPAKMRSRLTQSKIQAIDLITFFFNLSQLTRAGVPLLEALMDLRDSLEQPVFRELMANLVESLESGKSLSQAMALHPQVFDPVIVSLTHSGEVSGQLPLIFEHLTDTLKWQDELATQTKAMLLYPVFVGVAVLAITFFLMIYLVPQLVSFIQNMGQEIPLQTRLLLAVSAIFVQYWSVMLGLPLVLLVLYRTVLPHYPAVQYLLDRFKLWLWPTGAVLRKIILARFAHSFALMYRSGISILDCLSHLQAIVGNQVFARSLQTVMRDIESGKNLTQSFQQAGIFPPLVLRMLKVGEATGQLDQALLNISYFYDRDVKSAIKKVQVMIEPAMTILLGALLAWVMLSVLSPIYELISKLKW